VCYLGLSVPVIIAGVAAEHVGLTAVTMWFAVGVTLLAGVAIAFQGRVSRWRPSDVATVIPLPVEPADQLPTSA
jgi:hypothetical protein